MRGTVERSATVLGCVLVEKLCFFLGIASDLHSFDVSPLRLARHCRIADLAVQAGVVFLGRSFRKQSLVYRAGRDALILTLVSGGLTYREISVLRRGDIEVAGLDLIVSGLHRVSPDMLGSHGRSGPVSVYRRWAQVQTMLDRFASISALREFLDPDRSPSMSASPVMTEQHAKEPLVVRIDRWGYTPWTPEPLTVQSLSALTRAHRTGRPPAHRPRILWTANDPDSAVLQGAEPGRSGFVLDNAYYEHGIRARRDAHIRLAELDDRFDDINDRVDDLLRTLVDILDEHDEHDERERGDR